VAAGRYHGVVLPYEHSFDARRAELDAEISLSLRYRFLYPFLFHIYPVFPKPAAAAISDPSKAAPPAASSIFAMQVNYFPAG
jgi:hypothetical protein